MENVSFDFSTNIVYKMFNSRRDIEDLKLMLVPPGSLYRLDKI